MAAALLVLVVVGVYVGRVVAGLSNLSGSSPLSIIGCVTHIRCDSSVEQSAASLQRINIALYGYGGGSHDGAWLTDSIMVVSIQPRVSGPPQVAEVSIPRDWVVPIDTGAGVYWGRVNEAYSDGQSQSPHAAPRYQGDPLGGGHLADATLEHVLGIHIDHFIGIDFEGFRAAVDAVGGVDVNVPDSFTDPAYPRGECTPQGTGDCKTITVHFDAGPQHMDGARALVFARSRHAFDNLQESGNFARNRRQQLIIGALKSRVLSIGGIGKLPDLLNALAGHIKSDLDFNNDLAVYNLVRDVDNRAIEHVGIDDSNFVYECGPPWGTAQCPAAYEYARDATFGSLHRYMANLLPDPGVLAARVPVTVLDGSGRGEDASARWSGLVGAAGVHATDGGRALTQAATRVIDGTGGRGAAVAQWLAALVGGRVETVPRGSPAPAGVPAGGIAVVLGSDEENAFSSGVGAAPWGASGPGG